MIRHFIFLFFLFFTLKAYTQNSEVQGTVRSADDRTGLPGATVILERNTDATNQGVVTNINGEFRITAQDTGQYTLKVQFVGFEPVSKIIQLTGNPVNVGDILLFEETTTLQDVEIVAKAIAGEQKGDTTQFNASAFKTAPDANAQELVEKMPGIVMQDGKVQAQGEDVQQIFIDGKPFFGEDVNAALQNLPADVIAGIQVYDQKSDKALLSGIDDGERIRTINIVTKPNRRKGQFGKATAGYGTDSRYMAGASVNLFNEDRRITLTGLSNNINTLNYSSDPNSQEDSRTQEGIITTHTLGMNFIDTWNEKIDISGSYFYTHRTTESNQTKIRDFVLSSDSGQVYTENNTSTEVNARHQVDMRFDYKINENNRLLIRPSVSLKENTVSSYFLGNTNSVSGPINQTENTSNSDNFDYDFYNRMYYSHKFNKAGRSLNLRSHTAYHTNEDDSYRLADNVFYNAQDRNEVLNQLNQYTRLDRAGFDWESGVSYTEPVGKHGNVEIEYEIGNTFNDSDKRTFNYEELTDDFSLLDTAISNTFESRYLTQETELGYQYNTEKFRIQVEAEYQHARLLNDQEFPKVYDIERTFRSILPSARIDYKISDNKNIEFNYRTWTQEPSVGQLQDVIDNSNPLHLSTGNPALDQSFNNWIRTRFKSSNPETNQSFYASVQTNIVGNYVSNSTFIAEEPTEIADGIILQEGSQLSRPVNLDGYFELRSYFNYGQPVDLISSNINFSGSIRYSKKPGLINDEINIANASRFRLGTSISSNISEQVDFTISTRASYNIVENSLRPALNNNFFNQSTRLRYNWILWEGLVYRTDLNHQLNSGLSADFDNSFLMWNMSIGKKLFKNQLGELSLNVYDLLKQNNNIRRNITEAFVEDIQSNVLQRYFMLTFTYNIRHFNEGTDEHDYEELYRN
ncbi:TonB-dependent receptor [Catalinimonas niigatensis]|uniref:TonB-dependent receptor n=1 Tax=Catalinimonas niigatensis TaxID=1397264 RepID=UPI002666067C|nr:TonB-dependent receptor [Catalinimonas niigatensis]WPP50985.1 TonB-dependent receptor [Catalinimonas niigatensis]